MPTLADALRISGQLAPADQLRLIALLADRLRSEMDSHPERIDMLTLVGVGAELWREVDADTCIDDERSRWQG